jgi:hypothetical protein
MMSPTGPADPGVLRLGRRAQRRIGGPGTGIVDLGIIAMNPDPADPAARMNVVDRVANTLTAHTVRPGSELRTASWTLHFIDVVPAGADGYVTFTVRPTAGGGKDRDDVDA